MGFSCKVLAADVADAWSCVCNVQQGRVTILQLSTATVQLKYEAMQGIGHSVIAVLWSYICNVQHSFATSNSYSPTTQKLELPTVCHSMMTTYAEVASYPGLPTPAFVDCSSNKCWAEKSWVQG